MKDDTIRAAVIAGIATIFGTVAGSWIGYQIIADREDARRMGAKVTHVVSEKNDLWHAPQGCHECHGQAHCGGKVVDWENVYSFDIEASHPITVHSVDVHIYRVRFLPQYYALCPDCDIRQIKCPPIITPTAQADQPSIVCTFGGGYRPEFPEQTIMLSNLTDNKGSVPSCPLGVTDVLPGAPKSVSLAFALAEDYEAEVERVGYSVVQVLAVAFFNTDDSERIPSDPFLISLRVGRRQPEQRLEPSNEWPMLPGPLPASEGDLEAPAPLEFKPT